MKRIMIIVLFFLLVSFICFYLYGQNNFLENNVLRVIDYSFSGSMPKELYGFKVSQISDFHNVKSKILVNSIVENLEEQEPNIIVITGDLVDAHRTDIGAALSFVEKIKDIAPIYFVTGNHEAGIKEKYKELRKGLDDLGVIVLENETDVIEYNNIKINIVGIDDLNISKLGFKGANRRIHKQLDLARYDTNNYTILLAHRPEYLKIFADRDIDFVFSGHFHGGQIRLFGQGFMSPDRTWFPKYTDGIKVEKNTIMMLSRGIGNSLFPFRINNKPELVTIIFEPIE